MASQIIRELITRWGFQTDLAPLDEMETSVKGLKVGLAALGGIAIAGAASLFGLAKHIATVGDTAIKQAQALGISTDAWQEYEHAFSRFGADSADISDVFNTLTDRAEDAKGGMQSFVDDFNLVGLSVSDLKGKDPEGLFNAFSEAVANTTDINKRNAAVVRILGDDIGRKLLPMLDQGADGMNKLRAEAHELGVVISGETAEQAAAFADTIARLQKTVKGLVIMIGSEVLPIMLEFAEMVLEIVTANRAMIRQNVKAPFSALVNGAKIAMKWIKTFTLFAMKLINALGGLGKIMRWVAVGLAVFITAKAIMGASTFIGLILSMARAYRSMAVAASLANIKAMAIPLLVAALIVLVGLLWDDLNAFFSGQDSAIGELVKKWPLLGDAIQLIAQPVAWVQDRIADFLIWLLGDASNNFTNVFTRWGEAIGDFVFDMVQSIKEGVANFKQAFFDAIGAVVEKIASVPGAQMLLETVQKGAGAIGSLVGMDGTGASMAGADSLAGGGGTSISTYNGGAMTINQRAGESGEDLARRIRDAERAEQQRELRRTENAFTTPVEY